MSLFDRDRSKVYPKPGTVCPTCGRTTWVAAEDGTVFAGVPGLCREFGGLACRSYVAGRDSVSELARGIDADVLASKVSADELEELVRFVDPLMLSACTEDEPVSRAVWLLDAIAQRVRENENRKGR